ncbi:hypothetical protein FOZ60_011269 [Perkinsus olseni]|uniref:Uncharacterized protein n=1 Tax=Perkinsus olseni TaxID=32597 RepID=A0A7J6PD58_PEROL|nr:hypothetical protein FOZ60_011269 [Perkinsus olseni]
MLSRIESPNRHRLCSLLSSVREMRARARPSEASQKVFTVDNPVTSKNWPPQCQAGAYHTRVTKGPSVASIMTASQVL